MIDPSRCLAVALCIILLALSIGTAAAQQRRVIDEQFDVRPEYWTNMNDIDDSTCYRRFSKGAFVTGNKDNRNRWYTASRPVDGRLPWTVRTSFIIDTAQNVAGLGLMIVAADMHLLFKINGNRTQYVGTWNRKDGAWNNLHQTIGKAQASTVPCASIKPPSQENTLVVSYDDSRLRFTINDSVVTTFPIEQTLATVIHHLSGFGLLASGTVSGRFLHFRAEYTEQPRSYIPTAFLGAYATKVKEFEGKGSRYPVMSPNGQDIYYAQTVEGNNDDAWTAHALTDSTWTVGVVMPPPINNGSPNNIISVSQDGNELFIWGLYKPDGSSAGAGFSTTRRTANGWSTPVEVRHAHQKNKAPSREECLSADRSIMIASREIEGATHGEKDLYVSFRQPDGSYGSLVNLGTNINTAGGEHGPFLAADNRTLYWHSYHETLGDADIFVSKRLDDTWLNWSPRTNLGPHINTPAWDAYFTIHPSGRYAYMNTTVRNVNGIHRITLPQDSLTRTLLPEPVVVVWGRVLNAQTRAPLGVTIRYEDLTTNTSIGTAQSEPREGRYSVVLTAGRSYGFYAENDGFFPVAENIELKSIGVYREVERNLLLEPIVAGAVIRLNNLFFDTDKSDLRPESFAELNRLIALLKSRSTMKVSIEGHTDDRGSAAHNDVLSQNRAKSVLTYLTSQGVEVERLTSNGFGKSRPLATGMSDSDRQKNRRVEFRIKEL